MPDNAFTATVSGQTLDELQRNLRALIGAIATQELTEEAETAEAAEAGAEVHAAPRKRGRPPTASQAAAAQGNGQTAPAASTKLSVSQMRQESTDILKACWGLQPDGAEQVIALQQKFGVKRFVEVGDDKIPDLYRAAIKLQADLSSGAAAGPDTGPF